MGATGFSDHDIGAAAPLGFRSWRVRINDPESRLRSVTFSDCIWQSGVNTATCLATYSALIARCGHTAGTKTGHSHVADCFSRGPCAGLERECSCGFWAYTSPGSMWGNGSAPMMWLPSGPQVNVHGLIYGFGKCVCGPLGFRAGKAIVAALVLPLEGDTQATHSISEALAARFSTARIFPSIEAMTTAMPLEPIPLAQEQES